MEDGDGITKVIKGRLTLLQPQDTIRIVAQRLGQYEKKKSSSLKILGIVTLVLGLLQLVVGTYAILQGEPAVPFLAPSPFFILIGGFMFLRYGPSQLSASMGVLLISQTYVIGIFATTLPFLLSGMAAVDALYEAVSGFTTSGSSVFSPEMFQNSSKALFMWRASIEWLGGITTILIFINLLPMIGVGGKNLASNELVAGNSNYSEDVRSSALNFFKVYLALTVIETLILFAIGLTGTDSDKLHGWQCAAIAMSTVSTGGLLPFADSMASFGFAVQFVTLIFMIFGASNFFLTILSIIRKKALWQTSHEWTTMMCWFIICGALISVDLYYSAGHDLWSIWDAIYSVVSAGTSTGFAIDNFLFWPVTSLVLLLIVQFVGGCSGSTAGGIKIRRLMAIRAYISMGMVRIMHPGAVQVMEVDGQKIDADEATSVLSTVMLFIVALIGGTVQVLMIEHMNLTNTLVLVVSALSNSGAVLGTGSAPDISSLTKVILCFLMYLGRLELIYVLILFTRKFWRDVSQSLGGRDRSARLSHK